ncbi:hypothetical protein OIU84_018894 [Salix udensis]|uniref:Uncharacterized protein n=1 Tax=Salix udensis TaxID=889485 RepID=A0AAD6PKC3_9ROSI|nr:hypothetical protein OIU84_018894 [Salix udensis]
MPLPFLVADLESGTEKPEPLGVFSARTVLRYAVLLHPYPRHMKLLSSPLSFRKSASLLLDMDNSSGSIPSSGTIIVSPSDSLQLSSEASLWMPSNKSTW